MVFRSDDVFSKAPHTVQRERYRQIRNVVRKQKEFQTKGRKNSLTSLADNAVFTNLCLGTVTVNVAFFEVYLWIG